MYDSCTLLKGYPGKYKKSKKINNLEKFKKNKNLFIFHAGTKLNNGNVVSNGGRVLNITSTGKIFKNIRSRILKVLKKINWENGYFRKDIGSRVI